jgi:phosphoenolpyruvate-protein phosphotransferase
MARLVLQGRAGSSGSGIGRLVRVAAADDASSTATPIQVAASQRGREQDRLRKALEEAAAELDVLAEATRARAGADTAAIFEAQALLAKDPALVDQALAAIADEGHDAATAIALAAAQQASILESLDDDYIRARAADIRDVGKRVAAIVLGAHRSAVHMLEGNRAVLVAEDLDASVVAELRPELVAGVALGGGAPTGHAAIVARALGIPLVLGLGAAVLEIPEGEEVIVDGTRGRLLVAPDANERHGIAPNGIAPGRLAAVELPSLTLPVVIEANAGSAREVEQAAAAGAHGIGLLRTELLFLGRTAPPGLDEQRALYRRIRAAMPDGPVVFRTLDVGGDKPAAYRPVVAEANPALGVRGVRLGLRYPELFETQLRALLECAPERPLHVMFPMVATLDEVRQARAALSRAADVSRSAGFSVAREVHVGIMIEVPAAALMADVFAPEVDFFSIGTNDLIQYTMAADRTSADLAELGTACQPAVLRLIEQVCRAARQHDRPVAVCGEAAADPLVAPLLVGFGVSYLSVGAHSITEIHRALQGLHVDDCRAAANAALRASTSAEVLSIAHTLRS